MEFHAVAVVEIKSAAIRPVTAISTVAERSG